MTPARASGSPASPPLSTGDPPPRLILLFSGAVLARGRQTVTSRAAADGIAEGREAQPRGEHATAGDQPNFGAENSGHGLRSGRPVHSALTPRQGWSSPDGHEDHPRQHPESLIRIN